MVWYSLLSLPHKERWTQPRSEAGRRGSPPSRSEIYSPSLKQWQKTAGPGRRARSLCDNFTVRSFKSCRIPAFSLGELAEGYFGFSSAIRSRSFTIEICRALFRSRRWHPFWQSPTSPFPFTGIASLSRPPPSALSLAAITLSQISGVSGFSSKTLIQSARI